MQNAQLLQKTSYPYSFVYRQDVYARDEENAFEVIRNVLDSSFTNQVSSDIDLEEIL